MRRGGRRRSRARSVLRLRVAGLTLALRGRSSARIGAVPASHRPFLAGRGADLDLELVDAPVPRPPRSALLFSSRGPWRVYRLDGGLLYQFRSPACDPQLYKAVAIDPRRRRGRLLFPRPRRRGPRFPLDHPLDELLFQHRLAQEGALEIHGCGLIVGGRGVVLCGHSGAGKSTTARLWRRIRPDVPILNDDRLVVRPSGRRFRVWGTPWHGDVPCASPASAPLAAIFFLRHARRTRVSPLAPGEAAGRLLAHSFFPPWEAETVDRALETCASVATSVPCRVLRFSPDASAIDAVEEALRASPATTARSLAPAPREGRAPIRPAPPGSRSGAPGTRSRRP